MRRRPIRLRVTSHASMLCAAVLAHGGCSDSSVAPSGSTDSMQDAIASTRERAPRRKREGVPPQDSVPDAGVTDSIDAATSDVPDEPGGEPDSRDGDSSSNETPPAAPTPRDQPPAKPALPAERPAMQPEAPASDPAPPSDMKASPEPRPWPKDCEMRHVFRAHGEPTPGDTSKFEVPAGAQFTVVFYFDAPWTADVQLLEARDVKDNAKIVHHWGLFALEDASTSDGEIQGGPETTFAPAHLGAHLLAVSGPGASDLVLPPNVGARVPTGPDVVVALEIHYFNFFEDEVELDASGVELCLTTKKRPEEAAIHMLGRLAFEVPAHQRTEIASTCSPQRAQAPVHLISAIPHMHSRGVHGKMVVERASGESLTILDAPYDFREQRTHALGKDAPAGEIVLEAGDSITSTCTFENSDDVTIEAGGLEQNEMCNMMVLAWPAGGLNNGRSFGFWFGMQDELTCLEY